jgi:hypothetical protein
MFGSWEGATIYTCPMSLWWVPSAYLDKLLAGAPTNGKAQ